MKYLFEKSEEIMRQNGKTETDFQNIVNVALPRYGAVTPYEEAATMYNVEMLSGNTTGESGANDGVINDTEFERLNEAVNAAIERAVIAEQELLLYAPIIEAVKSLSAVDKTMIDKLTAELAARDAADEKYERLNAALKALIE